LARILVGYERGDNLGHYRRLAPVAEALAARGHQVTFFLRNPYDCRNELTRRPLPFIPTPDLVAPNPAEREPKRTGAYSDIMVYCGFGKPELLYPAALSWRTLLDHIKPDLIVCDHSPVICLAAYGRIPVVQVGDGFTLPPAEGETFPGFQKTKKATVPPADIVAVINEVQSRPGQPLVARLAADPVAPAQGRNVRPDPVIGPTEGLQSPMPLPDKPQIFAYLGIENRVTPKVLEVFKKTDLPIEAYVRGMTEDTARRYLRPGLKFFRKPQPIDQVLARATLAIHHGGSGMCLACCSAGRPQLALPIHEETLLNSQALGRIGIGRSLSMKEVEKEGADRLAETLADARKRERAAIIAEEIRTAGPFRPMDHILEACQVSLGNA